MKNVRYLAQTDDSKPIGATARAWLDVMLALPVDNLRILSTIPSGFAGSWNDHAALAMTELPPEQPIVNVVCCSPQRWAWHVSIAVSATTSVTPISGDVELYTEGMRNVLIIPRGIYPRSKLEVYSALKYQAMIVTDESEAVWWRGHTAKPVVIVPVFARRGAEPELASELLQIAITSTLFGGAT